MRIVNALLLVLAIGVLPGQGHHVYPGSRIQDALEAAARDPADKIVYVHAGTYRPDAKGQALVWFNARHDGITLQAVGEVILTAANPAIADPTAPSYPAVVNPRRLFRRRRVDEDGAARLQDHRREQLHDRLGRKLADRVRRDPQDDVLLHRRRRHQGQHLRRFDLLEEHTGDDVRGTIDRTSNVFDPPDARFDARFVPQAPQYAKVGYRPTTIHRR